MPMYAPISANTWTEFNRLNDEAMNAWAKQSDPERLSATASGKPVAGATTPPTPTNSTASQGNALAGNLANIPSIEQITSQINAINQKAQQAANAGRIPGAAGLEQQSSTNIGNYLAGKVPGDVLTQLGQQAAQRGVATGSPTGAGNNAAYLRALGLTSLDLMNQGQNQLSAAYARNPAAPLYNAGELVTTPQQQAQIDMELARLKQQQDQFNANLELERQRLATQQANMRLGYFGTPRVNYQGPSTNWSPYILNFGNRDSGSSSPAPNWTDLFGSGGSANTFSPPAASNPASGFDADEAEFWDYAFAGN